MPPILSVSALAAQAGYRWGWPPDGIDVPEWGVDDTT
jgi:hypothetical protein